MKTEKNNRRYNEMLARYLGGEMSGEEAHAFENEFSLSEEDMIMIGKMKNQWAAMEKYKGGRSPDAGAAWTRLRDRLGREDLLPERRAVAGARQVTRFVRIAALALILLSLSAVVYFMLRRNPAPEMVRLNTRNEGNTLVRTLADGSVIYIARNSSFSYPQEFNSGQRLVALKGKAFFDITRDPARPFVIETEEAQIRVLGTAFHVETSDGKGLEIMVERGKVAVTLKNNPSCSKTIMAGEKVSAMNNSLVISKQTATEDNSWYKQRMHFKDETLQNIFHVLNLNYNTNFALANNEIGKRRLTVTFHNETPETMTELICLTLNLKSRTIDGSVVFSENPGETRQP